jgi:toxin-antitoxin system PIN domain toxin
VRALFDVSTLLALFDKGHIFHARAHAWWDRNVASGWATCPISQNGFVRILSQPAYSSPRALADAIAALSLGLMQPSHAFWPDDISITDPELFDHSRLLGPNQITDVYLLGLAVKNGGRLVTFDAGVPIAAVRGATQAHLVAL